jgi:hypothetical protein
MTQTTKAELDRALALLGKIADCAGDPWPNATAQCQDIAKWATEFLFPERVKQQ